MEWLAEIGDSYLTLIVWMAGLASVFAVLVRAMPCNRGVYWWTNLPASGTDFLYWFLMPLIERLLQALLLAGGVAMALGDNRGFTAVRNLPLWQQAAAMLVIQDVVLYWIHRAFHTRPAWRFHAVHHSPTVLDWLSAPRFHFVNSLASNAAADLTVLLLGFSPAALLALAPVNIAYSAMVHANLNWTFGPLRYLFASPVFHRWHHTTEQDGLNKNFAPTFPFLDLLFGTFYMPPGRLPEQYGNGEADYPTDFWGQLIQPFRKEKHSSSNALPGQRPAA